MFSNLIHNAAHALLLVCKYQVNGPVTTEFISKRLGLSISYLESLMSQLKKNGFVISYRGPGGGYTLGRPMTDISVAAIIFAVDEPLDATSCGGKENCFEDGPCMTHDLWTSLNQKMIEFLKGVSLRELVDKQLLRESPSSPRQVSVLREHRAALEFPTSTLQPIDFDGSRLTSIC
jgi:Rrf2 family iron-sulfur cluster assembly transcriptional regulator